MRRRPLSVRVTVTDLAGRPIEGALVRATDGDPVATSLREMPARVLLGAPEPPIVEARTDADGRAALPPVECPSVAVSAPGREWTVRFVGREIEERSACDEVFRLAPAYSLRGRVLDEDGVPVARADVAVLLRGVIARIDDVRLIPHVRCDDAGEFALEGLGPGDHLLAARVPGRWWATTVSFRTPGVERIDVRVPPAGVLEGRVTDDATGEPVAGARVWVSGMANWDGTLFGVETDASGCYRCEGIAAGLHSDLWAEAPLFAPARVSGDEISTNGVPPGGTLRQDFVLSRGAAAEGTVTCDGVPVADAEVEVAVLTRMANDPQSVRTTTAPDGTWRVEGLGAGGAVVIVRHDAFVQPGAPDPWSAGDTEFPCAERYAFTVPATGRVRCDVGLQRADSRPLAEASHGAPDPLTRIRARVAGPDGAPLPDAVVGVHRRTPGVQGGESLGGREGTDDAGIVARAGPTEIDVHAEPWRGHPAWYLAYAVSFEGGWAESALHRVPPGVDAADIEFRIGRPVRIAGRVVRGGVGVGGARIHVVSPRDRLSAPFDRRDGAADPRLTVHAVSAADGGFSVPVARPGRYAVHVQTDDYAAARMPRVVVPGAPVEIPLPEVSEIEGAVVWPDATPCAGVIVAVAGSDARWYGPGSGRVEGPGWAMVRADGTFRVRGVAAGAPVRLEVGRHRTGRINVPTGWTEPILPGTRELRITVTPGRALIGRVVSPDCRPLQRVGVMVWSGAEDDRSTLQCDTTDADGRFVIDALWPPPWHVEAYAFPGDVSGDPTVGGPEVRVLYPGTYDDAAPVELVLDVPIVRRPRNAGDAAQVKP